MTYSTVAISFFYIFISLKIHAPHISQKAQNIQGHTQISCCTVTAENLHVFSLGAYLAILIKSEFPWTRLGVVVDTYKGKQRWDVIFNVHYL
jgi:hypothetical protein